MVTTEPDGDVEIDTMDDPPAEDGTFLSSEGDGCADATYNLIKHQHPEVLDHKIKWYSTMNWKFNRQSTPAETTADRAESSLRDATNHITQAHNPCGLEDNVSAGGSYQGDAGTNANINSDRQCDSDGNNVSVVSFGDLNDPSGFHVLAVTCVWFTAEQTPHEIDESDIKMDTTGTDWYSHGNESCSDQWSIEAIGTHERGHSYGLGHVNETDHPNLTMSASANGTCQNSESSLGKGDILGLRDLY
jgi:hypothetical protein